MNRFETGDFCYYDDVSGQVLSLRPEGKVSVWWETGEVSLVSESDLLTYDEYWAED
jgi:hypothetical protein